MNLSCMLLLLGASLAPHASTGSMAMESETPKEYGQRMAWWEDARFGMFVHWGPVSVQGTEIGWSRGGERRGYPFGPGNEVPVDVYDNLYKRFNPVKFDAKRWVAIAKAAGMKYLVFTTRHHDGFSMFDSKVSDYKITSPESPFRRDVVKELSEACHKAGMRFGVYYSQPDFHNPDAFTANHARYVKYMHEQVRELLTHYGRVDMIWFDGLGGTDKDYGANEMVRMIRELQPKIIINDRTGCGGDYATPEQYIGGFNVTRRWESCMTLCNQWSWKPDDQMKSLKTCLQTLIRCAGGDGNLLFNVGPMPTGEIEPRQVERLQEMGEWLARDGKTLYGTRGGPFQPANDVVSTRRGNTIYLHVLSWAGDSVTLPALPKRLRSASMLHGGAVPFTVDAKAITLQIDPSKQDPIDTIVKLELDGSAMDIAPLSGAQPFVSLAEGKAATASNTFHNQAEFGAAMAFDGKMDTRWATDEGMHQAWLAVDLGQPTEIDVVQISEEYGSRIQSFELQAKLDGDWRTFFTGTTVGPSWIQAFPKLKATQVRLNILNSTEGPTISEFRIGLRSKLGL